MKQRTLCLVLCCLAALLLLSCIVYDPVWRRQRAIEEMNATIEIADEVLAAIEAYGAEHGLFPLTLEDLVPTRLSSIPTTSTGRPFSYHRDDLLGEWYHLCFRFATYPNRGCCYFPRVGLWDCTGGCE